MPALNVNQPYPVFADSDGSPLDNGYIWIGTTNLDPRTSQITVYSDRLLTIPVAQPLRTLNGYFVLGGTPSEIFVNATNYSILVQDQYGRQILAKMAALSEDKVLSSLSVTGSLGVSGASTLSSVTASSLQVNGNTTVTGSLTVNGSTIANGNISSTGLIQSQKILGISTTGDDEAARFQHSSSPFVSFYRAGSRAGYLQSTATTFAITSETSQYVDIITGGTPRFSVSASGNVRSFTSGGGKLMDQASIRAWAKFNMSGAVGNQTFTGMGISSVVKNADNSLTINFSDPMPDANYAILQGPGIFAVSNGMFMDSTPVFGTTSFRINCVNAAGTVVSPTFVSFAVVR